MKASHIVKIIKVLESCKTSDQYRSWLARVKPMKLGEYHDTVYNIAIPKAWELCAQVSDFKRIPISNTIRDSLDFQFYIIL